MNAPMSSSSTMDDYRDSSSMDDISFYHTHNNNNSNNSARPSPQHLSQPSRLQPQHLPQSKGLSSSLPQYPDSPSTSLHHRRPSNIDPITGEEPEMVDATYSEYYGALYVSKPIRYIYPQGYGSMRPRSTPWKISIILFGVFAWLNVFIVGHCADVFDWEQHDDDKYKNVNEGGDVDDAVVIEARWCGSRTLYFTWVLSVALTGLSFAYCGIIGYVKARDFAVANGRSQAPGMVGKSDYYVQMEEAMGLGTSRRFSARLGGASSGVVNEEGDETGVGGGGGRGGKGSASSYQNNPGGSGGGMVGLKKSIYQADGTPRFLGGQIYKPTQAAVSLTSR